MAQWESLFDRDDDEDEGEAWKRGADRPSDAPQDWRARMREAYDEWRRQHEQPRGGRPPAASEVPQEPRSFRGHGPREPSALTLLDRLATRLGANQDCPTVHRYVETRLRMRDHWPRLCTQCGQEFHGPKRELVRCAPCRRRRRSRR